MELPKTRGEAIRLGVKYFYTGPCDQGHNVKRYACNGKCVTCNKSANRIKFSTGDGKKAALPFTEEGLLEAVKGCETRAQRINAMIKYYSDCAKVRGTSSTIKAYLQQRVAWLKEELSKDIPQRMYVTV